MAKKRKQRRSFLCRLSKVWFFLIGGFLIVEISFLGVLAGSLSHLDLHNIDVASARRKLIRFFDPKWRSRQKRHDKAERKIPPFHHSEWIYRRNFAKYKAILQQNNPKPLDGFYSRPHIPASTQPVPFLVVVGSDGSGTRLFVQTLMDLGVDMIVDSYDTMDVHGEEMEFEHNQRGWPPLATMILNETKSLNYTVQEFSQTTQQQTIEALVKFKSSLVQKGRQVARRNREPGHRPPAAGVQYGWKAPIAMVCLPLLQQAMGPLKIIHVVRDGRDVALSDNQSPVEKYFQAFYGREPKLGDRQSDAMQLWKDWNSQVWKWARHRIEQVDDNNKIPGLDYSVTRTEDLIDPIQRLEALAQLAEFVGARLSPEELCCLSQKGMQDMGQSKERREGNNEGLMQALRGVDMEAENKVKARYGKWRQKLKDQPEILAKLNQVGEEALRLFGYEPSQRFLDRSDDLEAFQCDETIKKKVDCM